MKRECVMFKINDKTYFESFFALFRELVCIPEFYCTYIL